MLNIGRASSGAIKIKTDGGLRAVECACCAPCGGVWPSKETTKEFYDQWRKGGQLTISGSISDTGYQIEGLPPNGTCSWSFSETITIPANTCVASFSKNGPTSCSGDYYGIEQTPSILLNMSVWRGSDGKYYSGLSVSFKCPFLLWVNSFLSMCMGTFYLTNDGFLGGTLVNFFGADLYLYQPVPPQSASLTFNFTPNP
jgi:hypothetical protein